MTLDSKISVNHCQCTLPEACLITAFDEKLLRELAKVSTVQYLPFVRNASWASLEEWQSANQQISPDFWLSRQIWGGTTGRLGSVSTDLWLFKSSPKIDKPFAHTAWWFHPQPKERKWVEKYKTAFLLRNGSSSLEQSFIIPLRSTTKFLKKGRCLATLPTLLMSTCFGQSKPHGTSITRTLILRNIKVKNNQVERDSGKSLNQTCNLRTMLGRGRILAKLLVLIKAGCLSSLLSNL